MGRRGHTVKLATEDRRSCKREHMVMDWGEDLQGNPLPKVWSIRQENDVYVATTKTTVGSFFPFLCVKKKSRHNQVGHIPPIQSYLQPG